MTSEGVVDVSVTLNGVTRTLVSSFSYVEARTPVVHSIWPDEGAPGTNVIITGENFDQLVGELPSGWFIDDYGFQQFYSRLEAFIGPIPCSITVTFHTLGFEKGQWILPNSFKRQSRYRISLIHG